VRCAPGRRSARCGNRSFASSREQPGIGRVRVRFAVNERYVDPSHQLAEGDEVAFFPPVSGGG